MTLDSRECSECGSVGKIVEYKEFDIEDLPSEVPVDKLIMIERCTECELVVFHVSGCDECEDEHPWTASGIGIANSNKTH